MADPQLYGGIAYAELFVRDVKAGSRYWRDVLNFWPEGSLSYKGLTSCCFVRGKIRLVLTGLTPGASPTSDSRYVETQIDCHGTHVADIGLLTTDVDEAVGRAQQTTRQLERLLGCTGKAPSPLAGVLAERRGVRSQTLVLPGSMSHTFVEELSSDEPLLGFEATTAAELEASRANTVADNLDHIAICVPHLWPWQQLYEQGLGAGLLHAEVTRTDYASMESFAVRQPGGFTVTVVAPHGVGPSQIDAFMKNNGNAPGLQHLAMGVDDILQAVNDLRRRGVGFSPTPDPYYKQLSERLDVGTIGCDVDALRGAGVLVDQDKKQRILLQIFTHTIGNIFGEVIERKDGAEGFGGANIAALFEAKAAELAEAKQR